MTVPREQFGSRLGFILAAAASAVGIGNLVGFPVNAAKNGGAAFLLIYALCVILVCLPVIMAELAAGRRSRKNPLGTYLFFSKSTPFGWLGGWLVLITPYMIAVFYAVITLWLLGYLVAIVSGDLVALADPAYFARFINSPITLAYLLLIAAMVGGILCFGVKQGIERSAKIMMPALFVMLLGLVVFVLTRDNALAGVKYYLVPDISKINAQVLNGAMSQAFFSLSLGMGILITYGSYMKQRASIPYSAKMVALTDTSVAFVAGLMMIPAIFSYNPATDPADLSDSSLSLIFSYLPHIFLEMQSSVGYVGASAVAAIFFLLVFFAALTSLVSIIEVPLAAVMDQRGYTRNRALALIGISMTLATIACALSFGTVGFLTELLQYNGRPHSLFEVISDIFYDTILPLNGFLICVLVTWHWRKANLDGELETGAEDYRGSLLERYTSFALRVLIPIVLLFVFINTVLNKFFGTSLI